MSEIAQWMMEQVQEYGYLHQTVAIHLIIERFGAEFSEKTRNTYAIRKDVLRAFKKLSSDSVVWLRREHAWRLRDEYDKPRRQQS